jgi:hypothetical protein
MPAVEGSGGGDQFVGILDIGDDIGGFPQRIGRNGVPGDGPVSAFKDPGARL